MIELMHLGHPRVISAHAVDGVVIDPGPASCIDALLAGLGGERLKALLLTHIHLDHAGASGSLVRRWPELEVYVHERGAPHLIDPSKLLSSAGRLYGERMEQLWGEVLPVPAENVRVLKGGEEVLGRFGVVYTPGHASHHVSYLDGDTAYAGDVCGVRIGQGLPVIPPTPPPDIDVPLWHESIQTLRTLAPTRLAITHFGFVDDGVGAHLDELDARLDRWTELARHLDLERFIAGVRAELTASAGADYAETYARAAPWDQLFSGLARFVKKGEGR